MAISKQERPDPQKSLVGFVVGDIAYAVPIASVREIVPVIDLRVRFGLAPLRDLRRGKWILIEVEGRGVGLAVDRVTEVFGKGGIEIKPPPVLGAGDELRGIAGVTTHDGVLTFVLEVSQFDSLTRQLPESSLRASVRAMR